MFFAKDIVEHKVDEVQPGLNSKFIHECWSNQIADVSSRPPSARFRSRLSDDPSGLKTWKLVPPGYIVFVHYFDRIKIVKVLPILLDIHFRSKKKKKEEPNKTMVSFKAAVAVLAATTVTSA